MKYPPYPALAQTHIQNAKLYATRNDMILGLSERLKAKTIAEVGVAEGDFSEFLLTALAPREFVAFDLFDRHLAPQLFGKPPAETYGTKTQLEFYCDRLKQFIIKTEIGNSVTTVARYPDHYFDMMYIDGDHAYEGVKKDAQLALLKTKPDGIIIFNDYIMFDHNVGYPYGIVPAVNQLIVEDGYDVVGLALNWAMFCDIAIQKRR